MAYLVYGVHQGEGFIVITGEVGAGKTMLVRTLARQLESQNVVMAQVVSTQLEADDLVRMVAASFGLPTETSKASLLTRLEQFLLATHRQGKRALLMVDEAQNLPPTSVEELRMLSNFSAGEKPLLQSFLLGQPEFRRMLQSPHMEQLRQRVIASCHLGPMDGAETEAYIMHRLQTVGWKGDPSFSEDAFDAHLPAHRRHTAEDQPPVRPPAAHGLPGREARAHRQGSGRGDQRAEPGVHARVGASRLTEEFSPEPAPERFRPMNSTREPIGSRDAA